MPSFTQRIGQGAGAYKRNLMKASRSGMAGRALGVGAAIGGRAGRLAMTLPGGYALMGAYGAAASYDPTKDSALSHFAKEGVKTASDIILDAAIFALPGAGWGYMGAKMIAAAAIHMTGLNPGAFVGDIMEEAGKGYRRATRTETPITQNERTMAYTRQAATMLGQTGRKHSFLGSEASAMHN